MKEFINRVISFYPSIKPRINPNGGGYDGLPCAYALIGSDGNLVEKIDLKFCHASLSNNFKYVDQIITSIPKSSDIDIYFLNMVFLNCFHKYKDYFDLVKNDDGDYYLHLHHVQQTPPQVAFNICVASRVPVEHGHYYFHCWSKLARAGVHPMLAFILSTHILDKNDKNPLKWTFMDFEGDDFHFFMDLKSNWSNLINGEPNPYTKTNCVPCNIIWGEYDNKFFEYLKGKTVEEISDHFGYKIAKNPNFPEYKGKTYERPY